MLIKPVLHRVLVKPDMLEDVDETYKRAKAAGLVFDHANERKREQEAIDTGVVIMLGATVGNDFHDPNFVRVGDRVVYAKYGGKAIVHPKTKVKYVALNDEDVIAILEEEAQDE
jgi:co-chaperonin GroES (HSP10)